MKKKKRRSTVANRAVSNKYAGRKYQAYIAEVFGGKSVGTIEGQDVEHHTFSIECKKRGSCAVTKWMNQCVKNSPKNKIPLLAIHITKDSHDIDLIVMRLLNFKELHKDLMRKPLLKRRGSDSSSGKN